MAATMRWKLTRLDHTRAVGVRFWQAAPSLAGANAAFQSRLISIQRPQEPRKKASHFPTVPGSDDDAAMRLACENFVLAHLQGHTPPAEPTLCHCIRVALGTANIVVAVAYYPRPSTMAAAIAIAVAEGLETEDQTSSPMC